MVFVRQEVSGRTGHLPEADFIHPAIEGCAAAAALADLEWGVARLWTACAGQPGRVQMAVHINPERRAVPGAGDVIPGVGRQGGGAHDRGAEITIIARAEHQLVTRRYPQDVAALAGVTAVFFHDGMLDAGARALDPGFDRDEIGRASCRERV